MLERNRNFYDYVDQHSFQSKNNDDHIFPHIVDIWNNVLSCIVELFGKRNRITLKDITVHFFRLYYPNFYFKDY